MSDKTTELQQATIALNQAVDAYWMDHVRGLGLTEPHMIRITDAQRRCRQALEAGGGATMTKPNETTVGRSEWSWPRNRDWVDDGISATAGDQGVTIAVSQEKAVSSYNEQFECEIVLPPDIAEQFFVWLRGVLGK